MMEYPLTIHFPDGTVWEFYLDKPPYYEAGQRMVLSLTLPGTYIANNYVITGTSIENGTYDVFLDYPYPVEDKDWIRYVE